MCFPKVFVEALREMLLLQRRKVGAEVVQSRRRGLPDWSNAMANPLESLLQAVLGG